MHRLASRVRQAGTTIIGHQSIPSCGVAAPQCPPNLFAESVHGSQVSMGFGGNLLPQCCACSKYVAGLDMVEDTVGWSNIRVRPEAAFSTDSAHQIPSAAATVDTHRGVVHAAWTRSSGVTQNGQLSATASCCTCDSRAISTGDNVGPNGLAGSFAMNITIPPGAQAAIHIPKLGGDATRVSESGHTVYGGATLESTTPHVSHIFCLGPVLCV
jgi:hypothetical protein